MHLTETLTIAGRALEYDWIGPPPDAAPSLVFLHEGLGSVSMWRDFPTRVVEATGCGAVVYSRFGYGRSAPCTLPRPLDYMNAERDCLGEVTAALGLRRFVLIGHSDGASISLLYAGSRPSPGFRGAILEAPHVFVEDVSVRSIAEAKVAYEQGDLRTRLARHHGANVDVAFRGWNDAWLDPGFRAWNIERVLPAIRAPLLVIQGIDDEYGTAAQVEAIRRQSGGPVDVAMLPDCRHTPHRDQADIVLERMARFIDSVLKP